MLIRLKYRKFVGELYTRRIWQKIFFLNTYRINMVITSEGDFTKNKISDKNTRGAS